MARIEICDYLDAFKTSVHSATSYQFIDGDTGKVLAENLEDKVNLYKWISDLSDGNGGHYREIRNMIGRVKFHYGKSSTEWINVGEPYDQRGEPQLIHKCKLKLGDMYNG